MKTLSLKNKLVIILNLLFLLLGTVPLNAESSLVNDNNKKDFLGLPPGPGPVEVEASFHLNNINHINDELENFEFTGLLILTWKDTRQAFDPKVENVNEKIYQGQFQVNETSPAWYPQVILKNESGLFEKSGTILKIKPDGTTTLIETINAIAEVSFNMRRHPFDSQILNAIFEIVGFDDSQVVLKLDSKNSATVTDNLSISQWNIDRVTTSTGISNMPFFNTSGNASNFQLNIKVSRQAFFMFRLVIIPLTIIVILSWSVFWMEKSSLADRISVSFIGILTAVAYQIVISDKLPHISYVTLINGFLNISYFTMCSTVIINLVVSEYDKNGKSELGELIDKRCRKIYPIIYFSLLTIITLIAFLLF